MLFQNVVQMSVSHNLCIQFWAAVLHPYVNSRRTNWLSSYKTKPFKELLGSGILYIIRRVVYHHHAAYCPFRCLFVLPESFSFENLIPTIVHIHIKPWSISWAVTMLSIRYSSSLQMSRSILLAWKFILVSECCDTMGKTQKTWHTSWGKSSIDSHCPKTGELLRFL